MTSPTLETSTAPLEGKLIQTLITQQKPVALYLANGVRLMGYIVGYDKYTLMLKTSLEKTSIGQLIYKHAISTVLMNPNTNHYNRQPAANKVKCSDTVLAD